MIYLDDEIFGNTIRLQYTVLRLGELHDFPDRISGDGALGTS